MKILTLGPQGSNSHVAAVEYGRKIGISEIQFAKSNYSIVETVAKDYASLIGVVPFETTSGGLVPEVVEAVDTVRPRIFGEYILPIHHCLACKGRLEDVKTIVSHTQALRQCSKRLRENYSWLEQKSVDSTSLAAEMASTDEKLAAICTKLAAKIYDLPTTVEDIQDSSRNRTRFLAISDVDSEHSTEVRNKTTLRYEVENRPAALWNAMGTFSKEE